MPDYNTPLNYVRCQWCAGNAGSPTHQCPPEAEAEQDEYARQQTAMLLKADEMEAAVERMNADLRTPNETATPDQLRRKLMECEEALRTTEAALAASIPTADVLAAIEALYIGLPKYSQDREWNHFVDQVMRAVETAITSIGAETPCNFADAGIVGAEATADYCYAHQLFCLDLS